MIFEINYFLFTFAQSNIFSYTFVFAKHYANVSNVEFGTLSMILPALAFFFKPIACSISDAKSIHKQMLICLLILFGLSYGSLGIIPYFKDPENRDTDRICWIIMSIILTLGYLSCSCIFCLNDALASNYARKHNKSFSRMRIFACFGWSAGAFLLMLVGEISWLPFQVLNCILLFLFVLFDVAILILWPYEEDFEMFHDGSTVEQRKLSIVGPNTMALLANMKHRGSISRDMIERIRAGRSKSVGYIPRQTELESRDDDLKRSEQQVKSTEEEDQKKKKEYSNFQCQMVLIKLIAGTHKSFIKYLMLFISFGFMQGILNTYQFDFFKTAIAEDDDQFKFLTSLSMIAQEFCGEILINIVAMDMLRIFGANALLSLALVSAGLRCFFYANFLPYLGVYSVILSEALQGPSLGLYFVLTVDIGSNYALMVTDFIPDLKRRGMIRDSKHEEELSGCSRATMIGIMSGTTEGLGYALGAFIGGLISASFGYLPMWNVCAVLGCIAGFANIGWDLIRKLGKEHEPKMGIRIPLVTISDLTLSTGKNETKL